MLPVRNKTVIIREKNSMIISRKINVQEKVAEFLMFDKSRKLHIVRPIKRNIVISEMKPYYLIVYLIN